MVITPLFRPLAPILPAFRDDSVAADMCTEGALAMLPSGNEKRSYED